MRVIDAATVYAGPLAATMLGDFGADVIKVEHPDGDSARTHGRSKDGVGLWWKVLGRNKRTVTAKLSTPEGRELFLDLVRTADVLIENFRPGVFERWGLSPELLHEINPGLIILRVTGFGQTGPAAQRRAFGTLIEAMSGLAHMTGDPDGPPTLPPFGLADGTAALAGAYATTLALLHRERGGARAGDRPVAAGAAADDPRPGPDGVRPARRDPGPARQPLAEQRPAQHLPDPGRPLGGGVGQLAVGRAAGAHPGRAPRGHARSRGSPRPGERVEHADELDGYVVGLDRRARRGARDRRVRAGRRRAGAGVHGRGPGQRPARDRPGDHHHGRRRPARAGSGCRT